MKKVISLFLAMTILLSMAFTMNIDAFAQGEIGVIIDGKEQSYDVMPVNVSGRVLVPLRGIFEALGADIVWRDDIKTVAATKGKKEVIVTIDSFNARIDGQPVKMDVAPTIIEGRTMVPIRFVSEAMGEDVAWDDTTKTVIITHNKNAGLKRLVSDFHRPVPTEFKKTNVLDDLIYLEGEAKSPAEMYNALPKNPTVMLSLDDLEKGSFTSGMASAEMTKSDDGKKVFRIDVTRSSDSSKDCIYKLEKTLEGMLNDGDSCLLKVTMRTTAGGNEEGRGRIQVQAEHPTLFDKDIWEYIDAGRDWETTYYSYQPKTNKGARSSVGFRVPFYVQTLEISEFYILNYGKEVNFDDMPTMPVDYSKFGPDKEWRNKALEDIEKYRKDDFNVVVVDKDGNPIKDAEVELDMFEHEFEFGSCFRTAVTSNEKYAQVVSSLFNAGVDEGAMKWEPYENGNGVESARKVADKVKELGVKYYRGHTLIWQVPITASGNRMVPEDVVNLAESGNTEALRKRANDHIARIMGDYMGELSEWDVINETVSNKQLEKNNGGIELEKEWFDLARKLEPGVDLFYNEATVYVERFNAAGTKEFFRILDEMKEAGIDYDGIGLQSHHDKAHEDMEEILAVFDRVNSYGKEVKLTEYSCAVSDPILQANFTRDFFISAFSKPYITGIVMWGFWDGSNFEAYSPVYDKEWNLKPSGEQMIDLIYNKWWTRDAKATTDAEGKATIRGFFGDYDVTVRHNGQEKTVMCAFGMGYDNTLYVTMD